MSLKPEPIAPVPETTAEVAKAAFPKGNVYMQMRDTLGSIYQDDQFMHLYPLDGQPAFSPWRLALVTVMQFAENLSDRQAADAVRSRLDWKYALSLELTDAGFHYSILSEFRTRLVTGESCDLLLETLLRHLVEADLLKKRGQQRTDSVAVLAAVKALNQLEIVGETMRHALNSIATIAPEWLKEVAPEAWYERYSERFEEYRLPDSKVKREALIEAIGKDGYTLYSAAYASEEFPWLHSLPAVEILRQVWLQQYWIDDEQVKRRGPKQMPPGGEWIRSPYDPEARYGRKRGWSWVGYKLHLTEVSDPDQAHFITQVKTVEAIQQDHHALTDIQHQLAEKNLLPEQHLVDAGYMSAKRIIESRDAYQIDLIGPVHSDPSWQARDPDAYDASVFTIDWQNQQATCPQGKTSRDWNITVDAVGESVVQIIFDKQTCAPCKHRHLCTRAKRSGRSMTLRYPPERHEMLQTARQRQQTDEFKAVYAKRSGVEGTFSQMIRNNGLRQARYIGMAKTNLQNIASATATNILRLIHWLNDIPFAETRISRFAMLASAS
jgi:transposase